MGALRTGGQGSVYKGRRIGEIYTAVKILPTPIHTETDEDKNFRDFQNEVEKLKKVNEEANPNVVKILSSGITESGSFPFIEMEFIEGPDLEELLQPPHEPIFAIREVIKVADQLASALAHCHKVGVRHGDIKSNNVKFNVNTGNYVLLDFGLAAMSDEQRRTSLRHAGAIEFMAPEQNEGRMLFQTDVYSYGIILYELLAGSVPFPLRDKGETTRNTVMVAHLETPVPDVLALRRERLPSTWPADRKEQEMQVPDWLLSVISTCLEKEPEKRFSTGVALHEAIIRGSTLAVKTDEEEINSVTVLQGENGRLLNQVRQYQERAIERERKEAELKALLAQKDEEIQALTAKMKAAQPVLPRPPAPSTKALANRQEASPAPASRWPFNLPKPVWLAGLMLLISLGGWAVYSQFRPEAKAVSTPDQTARAETSSPVPVKERKDDPVNSSRPKATRATADSKADKPVDQSPSPAPVKPRKKPEPAPESRSEPPVAKRDSEPAEAIPTQTDTSEPRPNEGRKRYTLRSKYVYFHNDPDPATRRAANLNIWNNAKLTALDDRNGFIYVVYTNEQGQTSRGWLPKKDLKPIDN